MIGDWTRSPIVWIWTLNDVVKRFFHYATQTLQDLVKNRNNYTCVCYFVDFDWLIFFIFTIPRVSVHLLQLNCQVNQTRCHDFFIQLIYSRNTMRFWSILVWGINLVLYKVVLNWTFMCEILFVIYKLNFYQSLYKGI